jgi:hypothetical protein
MNVIMKEKWKERGIQAARSIVLKEGILNLIEKFESLDMSPKNTHIEIQNYCLKHGLTQDLKAELDSDVADVQNHLVTIGMNLDMAENARWNYLEEFSGACANEIIRELYGD